MLEGNLTPRNRQQSGGSVSVGGSALDNAIIRADGTGGNIQYSAITVDDSNNIAGVDTSLEIGNSNSSFRIGDSTTLTGGITQATCVGVSSDISGNNGTTLGYNAQAGTNGTSVGTSSTNSSGTGFAGGFTANAGSNAVAIGPLCTAASGAIAFGRGANASANEIVFGSSGFSYRDLFIGQGRLATIPDATVTITATGGSGTDVHASDLVLRAGASTGNATPASVIIQTTTAGSSGATVQSYLTLIEADGTGLGFFGVTPVAQPSTTGTTTGFTAGSGTGVNDDSTFTGNTGTAAYTVGDIVLALKQVGILAAS